MANNLFVTYDLIKDKNYNAVHEAIQSLGNWAKVTESNWYVNSNYSALDAARKVKAVMDKDDKLIVVDASNNTYACYNLLDEVKVYLNEQWRK